MRIVVVLFLAAMMAMPLLPGAAAADHLLVDAAGDAKLSPAGTSLPGAPIAAGDQTNAVDLLFLDITEKDDAFAFVVGVTSLSGTFTGATYDIRFQYLNTTYLASGSYFVDPVDKDPFIFGSLSREADAGRSEFVAELIPVVDTTKGTISLEIPKVFILDAQGRSPQVGESLSSIHVSATRSQFGGSFDPAFTDEMPDDASKLGSYAFALGDASRGSLFLDSPQKVRVSNGGATTFVYQAHITNKADSEDEVTVALGELPPGWNGTVQSPVKIHAHESKVIPVLATLPFEHKHGGFSAFNITIQSKRDPASGGHMTLGVLHTPIPQPAGHHSELYLHSQTNERGTFGPLGQVFPFGGGWINTESNHTQDGGFATPNDFNGQGVNWVECLNPGLQMGFDFDLTRTGTMTGSLLDRNPGDAELTAQFVLFSKGDNKGIVLAQSNKAKFTSDPQKPVPFALVLTPTEASDYVPYAKDQNACLRFTSARSGGSFTIFQPQLQTADFKMTLPLNEYSDKLDGVAEAASVISLAPDGPVEKAAKPGTLMTYAFTLKNDGLTDDTFVVEPAGPDAKLGTLIPAGAVALKAHESKTIVLGVHVPEKGNEGQVFEVLVFVHAQNDPSKTALARTKTTLTHGDKASADESAQMLQAARAQQKGTPAPGAALLVGIASFAALVARRKG